MVKENCLNSGGQETERREELGEEYRHPDHTLNDSGLTRPHFLTAKHVQYSYDPFTFHPHENLGGHSRSKL